MSFVRLSLCYVYKRLKDSNFLLKNLGDLTKTKLELATLDFFNALKLSEKSNQITLHHLKALI